LFRNIGEKESGLFVTLGDYTEEALQFAALKTNLRLMKGSELINLIMSYYEELESRYKEILPLRKVYFPDALADQEDQLWKKPTG
jgi:restriction system protein